MFNLDETGTYHESIVDDLEFFTRKMLGAMGIPESYMLDRTTLVNMKLLHEAVVSSYNGE